MRTPRFNASFFKGNRERLLKMLPKDSVAIIHSANEFIKGADTLHPYRQDSSFFYLTGIESPGCSLLLIPDNGKKPEEVLFVPPIDPEKEKWEGKMLSASDAREISGIKAIQTTNDFKTVLFRAKNGEKNYIVK